MKSLLSSMFCQVASLMVLPVLIMGSPTMARAGDRPQLFSDPVRPGGLDYSALSSDGYLTVYSATDEFNDGGTPYYAHSSYAIYTMDGKLFKKVENHISRSDEIPEVVALPAGYYTVEARSEHAGYVRVRIAMRAGQRTTVDLDPREKDAPRRIAHS
jgi:hypothetical protein